MWLLLCVGSLQANRFFYLAPLSAFEVLYSALRDNKKFECKELSVLFVKKADHSK